MSGESERNESNGRRIRQSVKVSSSQAQTNRSWDFKGVLCEVRHRIDNGTQDYLRSWYDFSQYLNVHDVLFFELTEGWFHHRVRCGCNARGSVSSFQSTDLFSIHEILSNSRY